MKSHQELVTNLAKFTHAKSDLKHLLRVQSKETGD